MNKMLFCIVCLSGILFSRSLLAVSCPLPTQSAYKTSYSPTVYYITENCTKQPFVSAEIFFTYFDSWKNVSLVSEQILHTIANEPTGMLPMGPKFDPKYGALVKKINDPKVYLLLGHEKYWISSERVFNTLGYAWNWVESVDYRLLDRYTVGSEILYTDHHPNYTLIKYGHDPKIYQLLPNPSDPNKQVKKHIKNETEFTALGFRWDRIVTIKNTEVYPDLTIASGTIPISPTGCSEHESICENGTVCFRNTCIAYQSYLPDNESLSMTNCKNDEVYVNGKCKKASLNIVFYSRLFSEPDFNKYADAAIGGLVNAANLQNCKDNIRVHKIFNLCPPKDINIQQYFIDLYGSTANSMLLHPTDYNLDCGSSNHITIDQNGNAGSVIHEIGHMIGLWDQYCYYPPSSSPPNQVNFTEAECQAPTSDWSRSYCSKTPTLNGAASIDITPFQCIGNKNSLGGHSIMGANNLMSRPDFGFTDQEIEYIQQKIGCAN